MGRKAAITALCLLFATAPAAGKGPSGVAGAPRWPDSLGSFDLYVEGIRAGAVHGDTLRARSAFREAVRRDSTYAPAYYELASRGMYAAPSEGVALARRAYVLDSTNRWYHRLYGHSLLMAERYGEALGVYRDLVKRDPKDPDNYRLLAALYELQQQPYSALSTLDSAEVRFGRIPLLMTMKRQLLLSTRQFDRALEEAQALVEEAPYEGRHYAVLGEIYGAMGRDSAARASYGRALEIDSTDVETLSALADYYGKQHDFRSQLGVVKRLFQLDVVPLEAKLRRMGQYTADLRFYREYYYQIDDLASTLAIRYPRERRVVKLYADHLITTGELERALALYKLHTEDLPPEPSYFKAVIDIENYLQRPDSAARYVARALELFPDDLDFRLAEGNLRFMAARNGADAAAAGRAADSYRAALRYAATDSLRSAVWGIVGDAWHEQAGLLLREAADEAAGPAAKLRREAGKASRASRKAYERSLAYDADNVLVLNNYAYHLAERGEQLERALAMAVRVVALTDNNPTYLDTHAWILYRMGRYAEAKRVQQQAIALDRQGSPELMVHYGDILYALGERFMAETYWRRALEKGYDADEIARRVELARSGAPLPGQGAEKPAAGAEDSAQGAAGSRKNR